LIGTRTVAVEAREVGSLEHNLEVVDYGVEKITQLHPPQRYVFPYQEAIAHHVLRFDRGVSVSLVHYEVIANIVTHHHGGVVLVLVSEQAVPNVVDKADFERFLVF